MSDKIIHLSEELRTAVKTIKQAILDARNLYDGHCLAEMYGEKMMVFPEQLKAHRDNDRTVKSAYNFPTTFSEPEIVSHLFNHYNYLTQQQ